MPQTDDITAHVGNDVLHFPKGTPPQVIQRVVKQHVQSKQAASGERRVMVTPSLGFTEKQVEKGTSMLPLAGGAIGGTLGAGAGTVFGMGVGAAPGAVGGAAVGGAGGEALRQLINRGLGLKAPGSSGEAAAKIGKEGATQAAAELTGQVVGRAAKPAARYLRNAAERGIVRALAPSNQIEKAAAKKVAPGLLAKGTKAGTRGMLERAVARNIDRAGQGVEAELAKVPPGATVDSKAVLQRLEDYKNALYVQQQVGSVPVGQGFQMGAASEKARIAAKVIDQVQDDIRTMGPNAPFDSVLKVKRQMDDFIGAKAQLGVGDAIQRRVQKDAVDMIRSELFKPYPSIQKVNAEFSFWKDVEKAMGKETPEMSSFRRERMYRYAMEVGGAAGLGAAAHTPLGAELGVAAVALESLLRSTAWRTVSSQAKDAIAQAIYRGSAPDVLRLVIKASQGAHRATQGGQQ